MFTSIWDFVQSIEKGFVILGTALALYTSFKGTKLYARWTKNRKVKKSLIALEEAVIGLMSFRNKFKSLMGEAKLDNDMRILLQQKAIEDAKKTAPYIDSVIDNDVILDAIKTTVRNTKK